MPGTEEWEHLLAVAAGFRPAVVSAETFLRKWDTSSKPVLLSCSDGAAYVVKGRQIGRAICNDQIVAWLGLAIGAPVGRPALVYIPGELLAAETALAHIPEGVAHGSLWVDGCTDRAWLEHATIPENRARFLTLALLYGWCGANDHQVIYEKAPPHRLYSVDHGHFFPGGPNWTEGNLTATAPAAQPDARIVRECALALDELRRACDPLRTITPNHIANAVAAPPDGWGLTTAERVQLAEYLWRRRGELVGSLPPAGD